MVSPSLFFLLLPVSLFFLFKFMLMSFEIAFILNPRSLTKLRLNSLQRPFDFDEIKTIFTKYFDGNFCGLHFYM